MVSMTLLDHGTEITKINVYVKIPPGKSCGFVQVVRCHAAEMAVSQMQGYRIGNSRVRLSCITDRNDLEYWSGVVSGQLGILYQD